MPVVARNVRDTYHNSGKISKIDILVAVLRAQ